jgi:EmrB/QacA subfamily drug resistance transporter
VGIGPLAGGFLLSHFWWGSIFLVNVPVCALALTLGYFLVPDSRDPAAPPLDPVGALLSILGLGLLLWAIIEAPSHGWTSGGILTGFVVAAVLLAVFMVWELTYSSPMLDMRFFKNPRFSAASLALMLVFMSLFGLIFLLTQYLQSVLGYSTLKAGAILVPQAVVMMVVAPSSAFVVQRFGNKVVVAGGLGIIVADLLALQTLQPHSGTLHVLALLAVLGLGMGNVMAPATDSIMGSLPRAKAGVGSAMNDTTRLVGGAVGVAVLGSISASRYATSVSHLLGGRVAQPVLARARDSVGAALGVARSSAQAHGATGLIVDAARRSFVEGLHTALLLAAAITTLAMVGVIVWLPARARDVEDVFATPTPPVDSGAEELAGVGRPPVGVPEAVEG